MKTTQQVNSSVQYMIRHRTGVLSAIKDFCKGKTSRVRNKGKVGRTGQRKCSTGQVERKGLL